MKQNTRLFAINLQQGFIVDAATEEIYAAYSHFLNAVVTKESVAYFEIPASIASYTVHPGLTDSFSIVGWTDSGDQPLYDLVKKGKIRQAISNKLKDKTL